MKTISIKVANTAKLPLAISRGSEKQRYLLSNYYSKALRAKVLNKKEVLNSSDFKAGFYAGVRVMFSLFLDNEEN